jgi:CRISPR system Cascade subunit CasC
MTGQSVAKLADYDGKLAGVYGDSRDCWAYVDFTQAWPADKGVAKRNLADLADWVVTQVGAVLEA